MNRKELVEKMYAKIHAAMEDAGFKQAKDAFARAAMNRGLDAALSVAIDELLGSPSEDEVMGTARAGVNWAFGKGLDYDRVRDIFANRRAKLERVKTIEERVTVSEGGTYPHTIWIVLRDGENVLHMSKSSYSREDAEIYRLGLIQQLKDSA